MDSCEGPPKKRTKLLTTTIERFFGKQGGGEGPPPPVVVEVVDRTGGRAHHKTTKYRVCDNADLQQQLPYLARVLAIVPNFLPEPTAETLLKELLVDVEANWRPEKRVVAGKEIEPKRSSLIMHDTATKQGEDDGGFINQQSPLLTSAAYMAATGAVEEYVNREKGSWPEYYLYKDEPWKATFVVGNCYKDRTQEVQAHSDALTLLGPRPIIAGLSFGATRVFQLTEIRPAERIGDSSRTVAIDYRIQIPHNTLYVMIPPCQEKWKHSVPAPKQNEHFRPHDVAGERRISLTYRCNRHHPIPTCDHGTPCIMHVEQRADFSTYVWECDWAKHQERCKFRTRWTDAIGSSTSSTTTTTTTTSPAASAASASASASVVEAVEGKGEAADVAAPAGAGNGEQEGKEGKAGEIIVIDDD